MSTSSQSKPSGAKLVIQRLASQEQEQVYKNGVQKTVHAVVKAHPFEVDLAMVGSHDKYEVDFHKFTIECVLLYDNAEEKEVDYIKSSPVDWVCSVDETGEHATVEVKLLALTSQHEYMFFRIKFIACPPEDSNFAPISVVSDPIRVVSKQNQLSKNKKPPVKRGQKRNFNDSVMDTLLRIEETQKQQQTLINSLFQTVALLQQQQAKPAALPASLPEDRSIALLPSKKRMRADLPEDDQQTTSKPVDNAAQFERHLQGLVSSFAEVSPDDRAQTIHKVLRESSLQAAEVIDALWVEGLQREVSRPNASSACAFNPYNPTSALSDSSDYDALCQKLLTDEGDYFPFYEIPALAP